MGRWRLPRSGEGVARVRRGSRAGVVRRARTCVLRAVRHGGVCVEDIYIYIYRYSVGCSVGLAVVLSVGFVVG